jgi:hypothetical protein
MMIVGEPQSSFGLPARFMMTHFELSLHNTNAPRANAHMYYEVTLLKKAICKRLRRCTVLFLVYGSCALADSIQMHLMQNTYMH